MGEKGKIELTAATLHILAMTFMLCDHLWAMLFPAEEWLTCIGRIAFPIFAFMLVEGFFIPMTCAVIFCAFWQGLCCRRFPLT